MTNYNYPYPHQTIGKRIIGKPARRQRQTIKGLGATPLAAARAAYAAQFAAQRAAARQYFQSLRKKGASPGEKFHPLDVPPSPAVPQSLVSSYPGIPQSLLGLGANSTASSRAQILAAQRAAIASARAAARQYLMSLRTGGSPQGNIYDPYSGPPLVAPTGPMAPPAFVPQQQSSPGEQWHPLDVSGPFIPTLIPATPTAPPSLSGLGAVYRYPYYNPSVGYQYNPGIPYAYYLALLQQQQANWQYGRTPYGPYQPSYPYSSYPYAQNQQQQYYYVPYSSCVGSGGLWDSFANACTSATSTPIGGQSYQYPYGSTYPFSGGYPNQAMPSVVGLSFASGVAALNQAGYQVWELSRDGVGEGYPPGYAPNRAVITVNNGIITSVYQG